MGEELTLFRAEFNRSLRVESRPEHLSGEPGGILVREVLERLELDRWLEERLKDPRDPSRVTHPFIELVTTGLLLYAQGWRDQDDADALRHDPVLRLAVSQRRGVSALEREGKEGEAGGKPGVPEGLASQPTLSRLLGALAEEGNREVLRESLLEAAARRHRSLRGGRRQRHLTLDVDSLPIVVHGHQPGSAYNGHYRAQVYHPLVASVAELGDLLDLRLRAGNVHTAHGALGYILPLLDRMEEKLCQVAAVRMDAGFPEEEMLRALEERGTPYVARIKNNAALNRMAAPYLKRPVGRPPAEPRTWLHELEYRAGSWSRQRRVVLVVQERPGELFLHHFFLLTSYRTTQKGASQILEMYRERGTAEAHLGELVNVLDPALSSSPRPKSHYRGYELQQRSPSVDSSRVNEVILLLNGLAYNLVHTARILMERATGEGWSLQRFRERVLRGAARVLVHARRATVILGRALASLWARILPQLARLRLLAPT